MLKNKVIVLDPGHSGDPDPGACGAAYTESDLAWQITNKVESIIVNRFGATVVKTKEAESDPKSDSLSYRCSIANDVEADLFVSIHLNAAGNPQANGIETYAARGSAPGYKLASSIQTQLVGCLGLTDRGVKTAGYYVLVNTDPVAVLIEVAFISNPEEEEFIASNLDKAAEAIAQGIVDYFYV